jgi:D-glycero-D-manno-heptose 1,7-bisphosphate phosphatase
MSHIAVFLDRDGVINANRPDHVKSWGEFEFLPGALPALARLKSLGWPVVVVSNQAAIGRGLVSQVAVEEIHTRMIAEIEQAGGRVDRVFYCPHRPEDGCDCRKPRPGLLVQAARALDLDLPGSFFVGDAESDIQAALAVGCRPLLVKTGRGLAHLEAIQSGYAGRFYLAEDLAVGVDWIVAQANLIV